MMATPRNGMADTPFLGLCWVAVVTVSLEAGSQHGRLGTHGQDYPLDNAICDILLSTPEGTSSAARSSRVIVERASTRRARQSPVESSGRRLVNASTPRTARTTRARSTSAAPGESGGTPRYDSNRPPTR